MLSELEKKYGSFEREEYLDPNFYDEDEYWMRSIRYGARIYRAFWISHNEPHDGLCGILLGIESPDMPFVNPNAYICIEFEFINNAEAEETQDGFW